MELSRIRDGQAFWYAINFGGVTSPIALIKTQWEGESDEAVKHREADMSRWHGLALCIAAGIPIDAAHTVGAINRMAVMPSIMLVDLTNFKRICSLFAGPVSAGVKGEPMSPLQMEV